MSDHIDRAAELAERHQSESLARRICDGGWAFTDCGLEKRCSQCREFSPADTFFWAPNKAQAGGLHSMCRDCLQAYKRGREEAAKALEVAA